MEQQDITDDELKQLADVFQNITSGPWQVSETLDEWLVAAMGCDEDGKNWFVTTHGVHASGLRGDPQADAQFIVLLRNLLPRILREIVRYRERGELVSHGA